MGTVVVKTRIKFKRGTAAQWIDINPILDIGEPGFETDTNKLKIGDGEKHWSELPYIGESGGTGAEVSADGKSISIKYIGGVKTFYLHGFDGAGAGQIPMKNVDGVFEWINLEDTIKSKINTSIDSKSISVNSTTNKLELYGFNNATNGYIPKKGENGLLTWVQNVSPEAITDAEIREICI